MLDVNGVILHKDPPMKEVVRHQRDSRIWPPTNWNGAYGAVSM